ncbi:MAG: hypothetical protein ACHQWV_05480, partial [Nitrospirales bacterium]
SMKARTNRFRILALVFASCGAALFSSDTAQAQNPYLDFGNKATWTGTFTLSGHGSGTDGDVQWTVDETISGSFNFNTRSPAAPSYTGPANISTAINDSAVTTQSDGSLFTIIYKANGSYTDVNAQLNLDTFGGLYGIVVNHTNPSGEEIANGISTPTGVSWGPFSSSLLYLSATGTMGNPYVALPTSGTNITFNTTFQDTSIESGKGPITWELSWTLTPGLPPLDLVVKIPEYDTWRPTAKLDEKQTGVTQNGSPNLLKMTALLLNPDGTPASVIPDDIVFTLAEVSHEPGVSLNWPPKEIATNDPDLSFDPGGSKGANITQSGIVATFSSLTSPPIANAAIAPHDWGAWATLVVTATINGSTLQGHLEGDKTATSILLPKRNPNSQIASSWKQAYGVSDSQADAFDGEKTPNNSNDGDGLTLYEEYRGFYVTCPSNEVPAGPACMNGLGHIQGDVNKKDLFVLVDSDLAGEVVPGILNFAAKSKLKVHYSGVTLLNINSDRVINFNYDKGAHEVDQHAVEMGVSGAPLGCTLKGPGTPVDIEQVRIPHWATQLAAAQQMGRSAAQIGLYRRAYPSLVSHELGHAVDISHHGEIDPGSSVWSTSDGVTITETITRLNRIRNVTVLTEGGAALSPAALGITTSTPLPLWIGFTNGQHSGDTK